MPDRAEGRYSVAASHAASGTCDPRKARYEGAWERPIDEVCADRDALRALFALANLLRESGAPSSGDSVLRERSGRYCDASRKRDGEWQDQAQLPKRADGISAEST